MYSNALQEVKTLYMQDHKALLFNKSSLESRYQVKIPPLIKIEDNNKSLIPIIIMVSLLVLVGKVSTFSSSDYVHLQGSVVAIDKSSSIEAPFNGFIKEMNIGRDGVSLLFVSLLYEEILTQKKIETRKKKDLISYYNRILQIENEELESIETRNEYLRTKVDYITNDIAILKSEREMLESRLKKLQIANKKGLLMVETMERKVSELASVRRVINDLENKIESLLLEIDESIRLKKIKIRRIENEKDSYVKKHDYQESKLEASLSSNSIWYNLESGYLPSRNQPIQGDYFREGEQVIKIINDTLNYEIISYASEYDISRIKNKNCAKIYRKEEHFTKKTPISVCDFNISPVSVPIADQDTINHTKINSLYQLKLSIGKEDLNGISDGAKIDVVFEAKNLRVYERLLEF